LENASAWPGKPPSWRPNLVLRGNAWRNLNSVLPHEAGFGRLESQPRTGPGQRAGAGAEGLCARAQNRPRPARSGLIAPSRRMPRSATPGSDAASSAFAPRQKRRTRRFAGRRRARTAALGTPQTISARPMCLPAMTSTPSRNYTGEAARPEGSHRVVLLRAAAPAEE